MARKYRTDAGRDAADLVKSISINLIFVLLIIGVLVFAVVAMSAS